jgi:hypothetical protein
MIIVAIVLGLAGWFILMLITTNLIGMFVRGFFPDNTEELRKDLHPTLHKELDKNKRANNGVTIISFIFIIAFLYLLFVLMNYMAVIAALLLMIGRIPDLVWEINHGGKKITKNYKPKGALYNLTGLMDWVAYPVLVWSIYNLFTK